MVHERSARRINSVEEADRFAEKILHLREKYGITQEILIDDEATAAAAESYDGEPVFMPDSKLFRRKRVYWEETLFTAVCLYFDCRPVIYKTTNFKVVVGEPADRKKVIESYLHLDNEARREAGKHLQDRIARGCHLPQTTQTVNRSFLLGFSLHLSQRIATFIYNRSELDNFKNKFPEETITRNNQREINPLGLAVSTKISIGEEKEKRDAIDKTINALPPPPEPKINVEKIDDETYCAGVDAAEASSLTEAIMLPANEVREKLQMIINHLREQLDRQLLFNQTPFMGVDPARGNSSSSTTTSVYVQFNDGSKRGLFDFGD